MGGFANSISNNIDCVFANNGDFSGSTNPSDLNGLQTNGQLWIGSTALNAGNTHINVGTLTSPLGTVTIGYSSPNITLDITGGAAAIEKIALQSGTTPIVPSGGIITFNGATIAAGSTPVRTNGSGPSTMALQVQTTQAIASTDATKIGLAAFNSAHFTVDGNGFVSAFQGALAYTNVTHAMSPYTVLTTDYYLSVDCSAGTVTLNFPNAPTAKQIWIVKDRTGNASTNNITITTPGGVVTIDGSTSYKITSNYGSVNLLANATPTYEVW